MTEKERLIAEEEERYQQETEERSRKHKERISEIQEKSGWNGGEVEVSIGMVDGHRFYLDSSFCFLDEKQAKKYAERIELYLRMSKWADENNGEFLTSHYILWVSGENKILVEKQFHKNDMMGVYFSSYDLAEQAREKFGDEILRVWRK